MASSSTYWDIFRISDNPASAAAEQAEVHLRTEQILRQNQTYMTLLTYIKEVWWRCSDMQHEIQRIEQKQHEIDFTHRNYF